MASEKSSSLSLRASSWSPYAVGAGIGLLSWLVFLVVNKPLGMSTEISKFSGCATSLMTGWEKMVANPYWAKTTPAFGYSTVFLIFTAIGAGVSALLGGTFRLEKVPALWSAHHGKGTAKRMAAAFVGGMILLYGARLAGGCTSGHGISGTLQLAVSSWIFFAVLFAAGIVTARLLFRNPNTAE
ncbi:MAG: YeeE/YedE family protein [Verrucomicrobiae bacterium]|nr:YeeE/YedE family protein [Verrucomicrobiae bacterium]